MPRMVKLGIKVTEALRKFEHPNPVKWRDRSGYVWSFFCPLCRATRKVSYRLKFGRFQYIFQVGLVSLFLTLILWKWLEWKGIISFIPIWAVFETSHRLKVRGSLSCPHCGFDPYLYLVDIKRARHEIETYWRKKFIEKGVPFPEKDRPAPLRSSSLTGMSKES